MKKIVCLVMTLFLFAGCGNMNNTPTKKVEELLNKYQTNDSEVISDLDNVLFSDSNMTDDERENYREFMKKHYQDMKYKIKNETIDGDSATVDVEITVRNYSDAVNNANDYRLDNSDKFDNDNTFSSYRLDKLRDVTDTEVYTITFHLTKTNDEWIVDPMTTDDEAKLNGLYGVNEVNNFTNTDERDSTNEYNEDSSKEDVTTTPDSTENGEE